MTKITEILSVGGGIKNLRIGDVDVAEYIKEQVAIAIAIAEQVKQPENKCTIRSIDQKD